MLLFLLGVVATSMVCVNGDCQGLPLDHPVMIITLDCSKLHGQNKLCVSDCIGIQLGNINEEGEWNPETVEGNLEKLPEGELQQAFNETWIKCAKLGKVKVNRKIPDCAGFIKMGKCFRKIFHKRCPEWDKIFEQP